MKKKYDCKVSAKTVFDDLMRSKGKEQECIICYGKEGIPKKKLIMLCSERLKDGNWYIHFNEDDIIRVSSNEENEFILHFFTVCRECANMDNNSFLEGIKEGAKKELSDILGIENLTEIQLH